MTDGQSAAPAKRRTINPILKFALELGPLALFFVVYRIWDLKVATAVLMVTVVVTLSVSFALLRRVPIMPLVTAIIVLIFGFLTFYFPPLTPYALKTSCNLTTPTNSCIFARLTTGTNSNPFIPNRSSATSSE